MIMQSYTAMSHEGIKALKHAFPGEYEITCVGWSEDANLLRQVIEEYGDDMLVRVSALLEGTEESSQRIVIKLTGWEFSSLIDALETADGAGIDAAGEFVSSMAETLGIEFI